MARKRAVGGIRLSSLTEETTSPGRQRELVQNWADTHDVEIVGWAEDLDVSAAIPPWDRPELGPWLLNRDDEFELLIFSKLDRAVRSLNDFVDFDRWGQEHGVSLVILDPPIDMSDMWGQAMGQVFAVFAELERKMIAKRVREGYEELLKQGRWPGGRIPYGYRKTRRPGREGWYLEQDPEAAEKIRGAVDSILDGTRSPHSLVVDKILPLVDAAIYPFLRSRSLLGQLPLGNGDVLRDDDGIPVQRIEPILSQATWERLQAVLEEGAVKNRGNRKNSAPLLRVVFCGRCDRPLYRQGAVKRRPNGWEKPYFYYRCGSAAYAAVETCPDRAYRTSELEKLIFDEFLERAGGLEVQRKIYVPGEDHAESLETAQSAYADLASLVPITKSAGARQRLTDQMTALDETISRLEILPSRPAQWIYEGTGEKYIELWGRLSDDEKGALLREAGVKAYVARLKNDDPVVSMALPADLERRAVEWAASRGEAGQ